MTTYSYAPTFEIGAPVWSIVTDDNIPTQGRVIGQPKPGMVQFRSVRTGRTFTAWFGKIEERLPAKTGHTVYAIVTPDGVPTRAKFVRHNGDLTSTIQSFRTGKYYTVADTDIWFDEKACRYVYEQAKINNLITADPKRKYALDLIEQMYQAYGLTNYYPTAFRNLNQSCHQTYLRGGKTHQILLGYPSIERNFKRGFREYATIRYVWNGHGELKGLKGVWALCLHEFAHVLQTEVEGGRTRGSVHNQVFVSKLRELQQRFPFQG